MKYKRTVGILLLAGGLAGAFAFGLRPWSAERPAEPRTIDVHPGGDIQAALEQAAGYSGQTTIRVHAGTYRPAVPGQAFIYFNSRHDGVIMEAVGEVVLTSANPDMADTGKPGHPAIVNHVVYFGDGISSKTIFRGFKITGGNGFVLGPADLIPIDTVEGLDRSLMYTAHEPSPIEQNNEIRKTYYFFTDGAGMLLYGRSYPIIENVEFHDNYCDICGSGVSIQHHLERFNEPARFKNCIFRNNRSGVSGSAADVLSPGSWAEFDNCLFVGNASNERISRPGYPGYGALTVFPSCKATVRNCTFTGNRNGVDDRGNGSVYLRSLFWNNVLPGGSQPNARYYELNVNDSRGVTGCFIHGETNDLNARISAQHNTFDPPDPGFDKNFKPSNKVYGDIGYRPAESAP